MRILFFFFLSAVLGCASAHVEPRIKYRRYNDVLKSIVPSEIIDFYHNMTKAEVRTYREVKRELFRAHLNGSKLTDEEVDGFIAERSPSLLEKKQNVEKELSTKISSLPDNAQVFLKALNMTNVFKPRFECDARRECMSTLKTNYRILSDDDKLKIVETFPNFQRVFAWLMRFSGPEEQTTAPKSDLTSNSIVRH